MHKRDNSEILNPNRFTKQIAQSPVYLENMPRLNFASSALSPEFRHQRSKAIHLGARALAHDLIEKHGEYDLDANLLKMTSGLDAFYNARASLDHIDAMYRDGRKPISPDESDAQLRAFDIMSEFNQTLKEVINTGASKFDFNELLVFMTNMYTAINGQENQQQFHDLARRHLIGMRDEVAFEQVLIATDIDYRLPTTEEDRSGADFIIYGAGVDVKSSEYTAKLAREKAAKRGKNADHIIWSQIKPEYYNGKLTLPLERVDELAPQVKYIVIDTVAHSTIRMEA